MNLTVINNAIDELENAEPSLSNIRNLSALYNVRTHILNGEVKNPTTKELYDILPSYFDYIKCKRKYQMGETAIDSSVDALERVCSELNEFMASLYSCTDTERERQILDDFRAYNKK